MAWVGDATGIIKAQLAESVAGIINKIGSISNAILACAKMGNTKLVVAVLEVTSVSKVSTTQTTTTIINGEEKVICEKRFPTTFDKPEDENPPPMANPPPKSNNTPQGKLCT